MLLPRISSAKMIPRTAISTRASSSSRTFTDGPCVLVVTVATPSNPPTEPAKTPVMPPSVGGREGPVTMCTVTSIGHKCAGDFRCIVYDFFTSYNFFRPFTTFSDLLRLFQTSYDFFRRFTTADDV